MPQDLSRRSVLAQSAAAAAGVLGSCTGAAARPAVAPPAKLTAAEEANVATVRAFYASFADPNLDLDALAQRFFAPDCTVRWTQFMPEVTGPEAATAQMKPLLPKGAVSTVLYDEAFAKGPVVTMSRTERMEIPGKPAMELSAVTIFVLRDGKFVEYAEWLLNVPASS